MRGWQIALVVVAGLGVVGAAMQAGKKTPAGAGSSGPGGSLDTCGDVERWHVCVTGVKRRASVGDGMGGGISAAKGETFLYVGVSISSDSTSAEDTLDLDFDIEDASGNRYSTDDDATGTAWMSGGRRVCSPLGEQVNPGHRVDCWLVYYLTKGTPGIHIVASEGRHETRIGLGE